MDQFTEAIRDQLALLQTATPLKIQLGNNCRRASVNANFAGTLKLLQTPRGEVGKALSTPLQSLPLAKSAGLEPATLLCLPTRA